MRKRSKISRKPLLIIFAVSAVAAAGLFLTRQSLIPTPLQIAEVTDQTTINWQTPAAYLLADKLEIDTNTQGASSSSVVFQANPISITNFTLHTDPPNNSLPDHTTLGASWQENGVPMRLYLYFETDGNTWRVTGLNTYNGQAEPQVVDSYSGGVELFAPVPLGTALTIPNLELSTSGGGYFYLRFTNLRLQSFLTPHYTPQPSYAPSVPPSPYPSVSPICTRQVPTLTILPTILYAYPQQSITYDVSLTNQDTEPCGSSLFAYSTQVPSDFQATPNSGTTWIPAGATANMQFTVHAPPFNPWGQTQTVPITFYSHNTQTNLGYSVNSSFTLLNFLPGDINIDGHVNFADLAIIKVNFGNPYTIYDYNRLVRNFGR